VQLDAGRPRFCVDTVLLVQFRGAFMKAAEFYLSHLTEINSAVAIICRKYGLSGDEEMDFSQYAHLQLIEDDYKKIRAFKGSSGLKTYLYTVVSRVFIDRFRHKWYPSAEAKRLGTTAVHLERLVYQQQYAVHEACQILSANPATAIDEHDARSIIGKLRRSPVVTVVTDSEEWLPHFPDMAPDPEERIVHKELQRKMQKIVEHVGKLIRTFPAEDQLLIKLYFVRDHAMSDIARMLGSHDRLLYRRVQVLLQKMRDALAAADVYHIDVQEVLHQMNVFDM
jgi:RNA polymerase sigma factor (sigma-70 family)